MDPVRKALRDGTRVAHQRVDDTFSRLNLAEAHGYGVFLGAHALAFSMLAQGWRRHDLVDVLALCDLTSLDLRQLGLRPLPPSPVPPVMDPIGVAYVLAGSHFGKSILLKRWSISSDPRVLAAGHYLNTPLLKASWRATLPVLSDLSDMDVQRAAHGADQCFTLFQTCHDLAQDHMAARAKEIAA